MRYKFPSNRVSTWLWSSTDSDSLRDGRQKEIDLWLDDLSIYLSIFSFLLSIYLTTSTYTGFASYAITPYSSLYPKYTTC
jgi:hypothetical protein